MPLFGIRNFGFEIAVQFLIHPNHYPTVNAQKFLGDLVAFLNDEKNLLRERLGGVVRMDLEAVVKIVIVK